MVRVMRVRGAARRTEARIAGDERGKMTEMAFKNRTAVLVMVAVAATVVATLVMAVPVWAASKVFITDVRPDGGATSLAADSNLTAKFSKAMKASTIKGATFYLTKQGSS